MSYQRTLLIWLACLLFAALTPLPAAAAGPIAVDGQFGDWSGQACLSDPPGDSGQRGDITQFCWATNAGEATLYFMVTRGPQPSNASRVLYTVLIDTDDNGVYTDSGDRRVEVTYQPKNGSSTVDLAVKSAAGSVISTASGNWGDDWQGGSTRVEFGASFANLGITTGQPIRFYLTSDAGDRAPDSGDVQAAPVPVSGLGWLLPPVAALAVGLVARGAVRRRGTWR